MTLRTELNPVREALRLEDTLEVRALREGDGVNAPDAQVERLASDSFTREPAPTSFDTAAADAKALAPREMPLPTRPSPVAHNPFAALGSLSVDAVVHVPGIPGHYGHGLTQFEVKPGTVMTLHPRVENGRIDLAQTKVSFHPPLHNLLWVQTDSVSLQKKGDGAEIQLDLRHFFDLDLTKKITGEETIPADLASLVAFFKKDEAVAGANTGNFLGGMPFDFGAFTIESGDVALKAGVLPLGVDQAQLVLAPGNRLKVTGTANGLRLEGTVRLRSFHAHSNGSAIDVGPADAKAVIHTTLDKKTLAPTHVSVALEELNATVGVTDSQGKHAVIGVGGDTGTISFSSDFGKSAKLDLEVRDAKLQLHRAHFAFTGASGETTRIRLSKGEFDGRVRLHDDLLHIHAKSATLAADTENITLGHGAVAIGLSTARIAGAGAVTLNASGAYFAGTLAVKGTLGEGTLGQAGGPLHFHFQRGSTVSLALTEAGFGQDTHTFSASGELTAHVKGGEVMLPSGARIGLGEGALVRIDASELAVDEHGPRASATIDLKAYARPSLHGSFVDVGDTQVGAHVVLEGVKLSPQGFSVERARARVTGQLETVSADLSAQGESRTMALGSVIGEISDAHVRFDVPIPAHNFGIGPFRLLDIAPNTVARFTMPVANGGRIDPTQVELRFDPPISTLFIKERAITANRNGEFILDLKNFPDINLSKLLLGTVKMPATLTELVGIANRADTVIHNTLGRFVPQTDVGADPLAALKRVGAILEVTQIHLSDKSQTLGSVHIAPQTSDFALSVRDGVANFSGTSRLSLKLSAGAIDLGGGAALTLAADTRAELTLDKVGWRAGDKTPSAHGQVEFIATLSGRLPAGGFPLGGSAKLTALGENAETVRVRVANATLLRGGTLTLADVQLELSSEAEGISGSIGNAVQRKRLRNGFVFAKMPTTVTAQ